MKSIEYQIASMRVLHSVVNPQNYKIEGRIQLNNTFSFGVNVNNSLLLCNHKLTLKKQGETFIEIELETIYTISPNSFNEMKENGELVIPTGFLVQCGSISYGSLRGIVLLKAKEKELENVIIPPMYIDQVIKEPIVIKVPASAQAAD